MLLADRLKQAKPATGSRPEQIDTSSGSSPDRLRRKDTGIFGDLGRRLAQKKLQG